MFNRIKNALVSSKAKAVAAASGATADAANSAVFAGVAANKLLEKLFPVIGGAVTAATLANLPSLIATLSSNEVSRKDKVMAVLNLGPATLLFYAIFIAEAAVAPYLFTYVLGTSWGLEAVDVLLEAITHMQLLGQRPVEGALLQEPLLAEVRQEGQQEEQPQGEQPGEQSEAERMQIEGQQGEEAQVMAEQPQQEEQPGEQKEQSLEEKISTHEKILKDKAKALGVSAIKKGLMLSILINPGATKLGEVGANLKAAAEGTGETFVRVRAGAVAAIDAALAVKGYIGSYSLFRQEPAQQEAAPNAALQGIVVENPPQADDEGDALGAHYHQIVNQL